MNIYFKTSMKLTILFCFFLLVRRNFLSHIKTVSQKTGTEDFENKNWWKFFFFSFLLPLLLKSWRFQTISLNLSLLFSLLFFCLKICIFLDFTTTIMLIVTVLLMIQPASPICIARSRGQNPQGVRILMKPFKNQKKKRF